MKIFQTIMSFSGSPQQLPLSYTTMSDKEKHPLSTNSKKEASPTTTTTTIAKQDSSDTYLAKLAATTHSIPLIEYMQKLTNTNSIAALWARLMVPNVREMLIKNLRKKQLYTCHLKPAERNTRLYCYAFSTMDADNQHAYCNYTVHEHYKKKHDLYLRYPFLPCFVHRDNRSGHIEYYPLEFIVIVR